MRRKRIAILIAGLNREYQQDYTRGMADEAALHDADLCIFNVRGYIDKESSLNLLSERMIFDLPELSDFDAIVAFIATFPSPEDVSNILRRLRRNSHIPQLFVDFDSDYAATMNFDDATSVRRMMEHLTAVHHYKTFAIVAGPYDNPVADARMRTAIESIEAGGGTVLSGGIYCGSWLRTGGYACGQEIIAKGKLPDVIVCMNDDMAMGVIEAFREHNLHVPEDVCVTGFDSRPEAVASGLTTILRPVYDAGQKTIRTLMEWANGHEPAQKHIMQETQIIYGSSCGCPPDISNSTHYLRSMARSLYQMDQTLMRSSSFSSALFDVHNEHEIGLVMNRFAKSWGVNEMHLCVMPTYLNPDPPVMTEPYSRQMMLLSSHTSGKSHGQVLFSTRKLLPILDDEDRGPLALVFNPLYYSSRTFGYVVLDLEFASTLALYSLLPLLDGALMNLNQQSTIRSYADTMESMTLHDPLTGLINRRGYLRKAADMMETARREHRWFAVLSADLDGMKRINDHHGHQAGDQAICRLATAIRALERIGAVCVHVSGDEFIAFGMVNGAEGAQRMHDMLHDSLDNLNHTSPWVCELTTSVGVYAAIPIQGEIPDDYLKRADNNMYREKRNHHMGGKH